MFALYNFAGSYESIWKPVAKTHNNSQAIWYQDTNLPNKCIINEILYKWNIIHVWWHATSRVCAAHECCCFLWAKVCHIYLLRLPSLSSGSPAWFLETQPCISHLCWRSAWQLLWCVWGFPLQRCSPGAGQWTEESAQSTNINKYSPHNSPIINIIMCDFLVIYFHTLHWHPCGVLQF